MINIDYQNKRLWRVLGEPRVLRLRYQELLSKDLDTIEDVIDFLTGIVNKPMRIDCKDQNTGLILL